MNKKIKFNQNGIAISIPKFGFHNDSIGPFFEIKLKNFTKDTLFFNNENFQVIIDSDTLDAFITSTGSDSIPDKLNPDEKISLKMGCKYFRLNACCT